MAAAQIRRRAAALSTQRLTCWRNGTGLAAASSSRYVSSTANATNNVDLSFSAVIPEGDDKQRLVCDSCGFVRYENPLLVCGVLATVNDKLLLVKRDIEPRKGYWTIPGGYMECGESTEAAAAREAFEEAGAEVQIKHLISVYSVPHISQVHMWYRADLRLPDTPEAAEALAAEEPYILHAPAAQTSDQEAEFKSKFGFAPAHESSAVGLFPLDNLPWGKFAFPSAEDAIRFHLDMLREGGSRAKFAVHSQAITRAIGSGDE